MSVTYPVDKARPYGEPTPALTEENFVPVYARGRKTTRGSGGKVKTWMILAPIGVIVLGGITAALVLTPKPDTTIGQAPTQARLPTAAEAAAAEALTSAAAPAPVRIEPAPVAEAAPPVRQAAPVRRVAAPAPAARRVAPAPAARVQTPATAAPVAGPRPYAAPTTTLNTAPATPAPVPAPTPAAPPPIVVEPLG